MRWRAIPSSRTPIGDLGTGAATTTPAIPTNTPLSPHRRAGEGRYPGDGRGNHHNPHPPTNTPVPPPPSCRRRPVPRGRARQLPKPPSPNQHPTLPTTVLTAPEPEPRGARDRPITGSTLPAVPCRALGLQSRLPPTLSSPSVAILTAASPTGSETWAGGHRRPKP